MMAEKLEKGRKRSLSPSEHAKAKKRVKLTAAEIKEFKRDKIIACWKEQDLYIDSILAQLENSAAEEVTRLKESEAKLQSQVQELTRRENVLNMRLATKQEEVRNVLAQLQDLKESQNSESSSLHNLALDPSVNLLYQQMSTELKNSREKLEQAQNDLSAWKFTPDSVTGKKLMSKCRSLLQENQDLGKQISQGRVAQLEAEMSLHKKHCSELKAAYEEVTEYIVQQDEECECLLATIISLKQQLKAKDSTKPSTISTPTTTSERTSTTNTKMNGPTLPHATSGKGGTNVVKLDTARSQE